MQRAGSPLHSTPRTIGASRIHTLNSAIRFNDAGAYERYMGIWSQRVGDVFLDWLAAPQDQRWLDVGCGNGAFTERVAARCAPRSLHGVDPAQAQLAYARQRSYHGVPAEFTQGDAMALPYEDDRFDVAVMPLVIFFVPEPARGVAEMCRVVRSGGLVSAYGWDLDGTGFPYEPLLIELRAAGFEVPSPPSRDAAGMTQLCVRWHDAGLRDVEAWPITVQRRYDSFDDYWQTVLGGPNAAPLLAAMSESERGALQQRLRLRLGVVDDAAPLLCEGTANAVKGRVP